MSPSFSKFGPVGAWPHREPRPSGHRSCRLGPDTSSTGDPLRASISLRACRSLATPRLAMVTLLVPVAGHRRFLGRPNWPFTSPACRRDDVPISTARIHSHLGLGVHRPGSGTETRTDELATSAAKTGPRTVMTCVVNHCQSGLLDDQGRRAIVHRRPCTVPLPGVSPGGYRTGLIAAPIG